MKNDQKVILVLLSLLAFKGYGFSEDNPNRKPGQETHGEDGFTSSVDGQTRVFEALECDHPFDPKSFDRDVWNILSGWLSVLKEDLVFSSTSDYLRSYFTKGRLRWCFVAFPLKDVDDTGKLPTGEIFTNDESGKNVTLFYKKVQIASTSENRSVYIDEKLFLTLPQADKAILFLHEVMWHAVGFAFVKDAEAIRFLVNLIAEGTLQDRNHESLLSLFLSHTSDIEPGSLFLKSLDLDHKNENYFFKEFRPVLRFDLANREEVFYEQVATDGTVSRLISPLNPHLGDFALYVDKMRKVYQVSSSHDAQEALTFLEINPNELCSDLKESSGKPWRLPTGFEIQEMMDRGLAGVDSKFESSLELLVFDNNQPDQATVRPVKTHRLIPVHGELKLALVTMDLGLISVTEGYREISSRYTYPTAEMRNNADFDPRRVRRQQENPWPRPLVFPVYFCICDL